MDARAVHQRLGVRLGTDARLNAYSPEVVSTIARRSLIACLGVAAENAQKRGDRMVTNDDFASDAIFERIVDDPEIQAIPAAVTLAVLPIVLGIAAEEMARG